MFDPNGPRRGVTRTVALLSLGFVALAGPVSAASKTTKKPVSRSTKPTTKAATTVAPTSAVPTSAALSPVATTSPAASSLRTKYPLTITDCGGHSSTFKAAPKVTVTMDPQAYELMFWLGLGQKQLAAGPQPLPAVPDQFKDATKTVTTIARAANADYVSKEALLAAAPDFVFASYSSAFAPPSNFTEDELGAKGMNVYWSFGIGGCAGESATAPRTTLDATFKDLENLGKIFDIQDKALEVESKMKADLKSALASIKSTRKLKVTTIGTDGYVDGKPGFWGANSTVNAIITLAGGLNAFGDQPGGYATTNFEEFVKRNPDVVLLVAYPAAIPKGWDDEEAWLTSNPLLANVSAIKNKRFVRVTFPEVGAGGIRNVDGVVRLAAVLSKAMT